MKRYTIGKGATNMVMTIVEAKVARENWPALKEAYEAGTERPPPQLYV